MPLAEDEEEEAAFLPSSPRNSRPPTAGKDVTPPVVSKENANKENESSKESDSFSDLSDASVSKSALEEALAEEHLRRGGSVAASQMLGGGVRSIWKGKFTG